MRIIKKSLQFLLILFVLSASVLSESTDAVDRVIPPSDNPRFWEFQSIDTMKYSRDVAREKLTDSSFDEIIDRQVKQIAETGATHVAVATPYDEEFYPYLTRWVNTARKYDLNVWFRGNWSGWEGWFDYPSISREEHINKTTDFIKSRPGLFEVGDIFSGCPECENGGPGDPRRTGDVEEYRQFLIDEYIATSEAFRLINRNVKSNYFPMNGDVARLVMDHKTTRALGGIVVIDHYVSTPEKLEQDIKSIAESSGGRVVMGEYGVPIPDIHGNITDGQQAEWIEESLARLSNMEELIGINYWTGVGGSTEIWDFEGKPNFAVEVITKYFSPTILTGRIQNELGNPISDSLIQYGGVYYETDAQGNFRIPTVESQAYIEVMGEGYAKQNTRLRTASPNNIIVLKKSQEGLIFKIRKFFKNLYISLFS